MFVSKRVVKGKAYYSLEDRVNGKRISIALGAKKRAAGRLEGALEELLRKKALERLRLARKTRKAGRLTLSQQLALERLKADYRLLRDFFPQGFAAFREDEFVRYAQGSASVEGNSLSLQEAALVLEKGASVGGKRVEEIREMENMKKAARVSGKIRNLNESGIRRINAAILNGFEEKAPGKYRDGPIFITGSRVRPPPAGNVKGGMKKLLAWHEKIKEAMHPVELAAEFHARFEEIHPFSDGNGRTGREILNWMLQEAGYPRAIINLENRQVYLSALERFQQSKDYAGFSSFVFRCLEKRAEEISVILAENRGGILKRLAAKKLKPVPAEKVTGPSTATH